MDRAHLDAARVMVDKALDLASDPKAKNLAEIETNNVIASTVMLGAIASCLFALVEWTLDGEEQAAREAAGG